jgi:hypothetical protein
MAITNTQLRTLIGRELEVLPSNRTALNAADAAVVDEYIAGVRAWLIEEGLCYWADGTIPDAVKLPLAYIVAEEAKNVFGKATYSKGPKGFALLKEHCAARPSGEPTKAEYF